MNINKVKWFHRVARWLGLWPVYECRFAKESERVIVGTLEWQTTDLNEALSLWQKSTQYSGAKRGKFYFEVHLHIDKHASQGTEKQSARNRRQIKLDLPPAVSSEADAGPHEPARQEAEAHEAVRTAGGGAVGEQHLGNAAARPHEPVVGRSQGQGPQGTSRPPRHDREQAKPSLNDIGVFSKK